MADRKPLIEARLPRGFEDRAAADILASAVESIVDSYRHADSAAAVRGAEVNKALSDAVVQLQAGYVQQPQP